MSARDDHTKAVAEQVIKALEDGTAPWLKPWKAGRPGMSGLPFNPNSGKQYRGGNLVHLMLRQMELGSTDSRWMTYKQAEALGAQVRKGEKSSAIEYWKKTAGKAKDGDGEADEDTAEATRSRLTVFHARVFNAAQIDGLPPPKVAEDAPEVPEDFRVAAVESVLERLGVPIRHIEGDSAFYMPSTDSIQLPEKHQFRDASGYYATALHEAGHATGHPSRLNRDLSGGFGSIDYAKEELRAELFSFMAGDALGIGHDPGQHHAYIKSWIRILKDDPREVFRAASDAQKIMDFLGVEPLTPELVAEANNEKQFLREFDLTLQARYGVSIDDVGLSEADLFEYKDADSVDEAVESFAQESDLFSRLPSNDSEPDSAILEELERVRAQRDKLIEHVKSTKKPTIEQTNNQENKP